MSNITNEEWRALPGYEGLYEVSSLGRIKSVPRITLRCGKPLINRGKILKTPPTKGYPRFNVRKDVEYIRTSKLSCKKIAEEFGMSVNTIWFIRKRKTWKHVK
jgi:hypothetical protein